MTSRRRSAVSQEQPVPGDAVAIVGLACRLPEAPDPDSFWRLLREGRSGITETPEERWTGLDAIGDQDVPHRGGFLDRVDGFDPAFFGISPREAAVMDPQQRLMLELSWEALEDAGIVPESLRDTRTGVFTGAIMDDYAALVQRLGADAINQHTVTGLHRSIIANRVSYTLGLHGPSMTIDAAQSSSLVAVHMACESLYRGESSVAIVGGVNLNLIPESTVGVARFGGLSPDGNSYTFDARANGYVRGEGGGAVVLKPLSRALADGDRVYCVIRGSAVNNDGSTDGLTVPSPSAQEDALRTAYERADVNPGDVQYVELHGTGTRVGDPIEAAALGAAVSSERDADDPLVVGSVKTNVGHLEGAAGIVGLLKAALSIHHRAIPASLNFETPNPDIPFDELRLRVNTGFGPWPRPERPLLAGVSSFGMGGTNCHVVLAEGPDTASTVDGKPDTGSGAGPAAWLLSAKNRTALAAQAERLRERVESDPGVSVSDVAFSLGSSRALFDHRAVTWGRDRDELLRGLAALAGGEPARNVVTGVAGSPGRVALLFTGQGSQRPGMGRALFEVFPVFAQAL
uniref:type I polyketide synthase n=1 Tax=Nocardiopsis deserti TaxID=2605988 RepID=UPI0029584CF2